MTLDNFYNNDDQDFIECEECEEIALDCECDEDSITRFTLDEAYDYLIRETGINEIGLNIFLGYNGYRWQMFDEILFSATGEYFATRDIMIEHN